MLIEKMEGQLTATIFSEPNESSAYKLIINSLRGGNKDILQNESFDILF